jgi:hypothetical protein
LGTEDTLATIKKKAKKAGWAAGETSVSRLSAGKFSRMCRLRIAEEEEKKRKFGKKLCRILKLKTRNS